MEETTQLFWKKKKTAKGGFEMKKKIKEMRRYFTYSSSIVFLKKQYQQFGTVTPFKYFQKRAV